MLASSLDNIFDVMSINEDCYGAGHFAKLMATELANLPSARARRKVIKINKPRTFKRKYFFGV